MRRRSDKMKKLGTLIVIVDKANREIYSSHVEVQDLLNAFDGFVDKMDNDSNRVDDQ